jgi:RNA polymerase sigma-70 factor (ECF subfamily)
MDPSTRRALADWTRAQPAVSAFVHALVHDRSERDDVLQDVAVAVLESHHRYDPARPFLAWALTIARNEVVDSLRRRRRRPALLGPEAADALAGAIADLAEGEQARLARLADCMSELDRRAREACELRYRAGLSNAQVAEALGMQANTASKLLQRVRERLRECIESRHRREARA